MKCLTLRQVGECLLIMHSLWRAGKSQSRPEIGLAESLMRRREVRLCLWTEKIFLIYIQSTIYRCLREPTRHTRFNSMTMTIYHSEHNVRSRLPAKAGFSMLRYCYR